jgi:ATP/ADP translocase
MHAWRFISDASSCRWASGAHQVRTWVYTVFYIASELWGDVILSLLFWGLANERTSVQDAHIMYPLLGFGANVAQSVSGRTMKLLNQTLALPYHQSVTAMMLLCIALCALPCPCCALSVRRRVAGFPARRQILRVLPRVQPPEPARADNVW